LALADGVADNWKARPERITIAVEMIELRHLRYFVAVAKELNFSRAAERLHMAAVELGKLRVGFSWSERFETCRGSGRRSEPSTLYLSS
jgi:hypothetical protein